MNATEKPERKSEPPRRESKPPGKTIGVDTSRLRKHFGEEIVEGVQDIADQVAGTKATVVATNLGKEIGEVTRSLEEIRLQRLASRNDLEDARTRLKKAEKKLDETEKSATVAEAIAGGHVYAIDKIRGEIEEINLDVYTALSDNDEMDGSIETLFKEVAGLSKKLYELKDCAKEAIKKLRDSTAEAIANETKARENQIADLKELVRGLILENEQVKKDAAYTKKLAEDASHDSEAAVAAAQRAEEIANGAHDGVSDVSGNLHRMGQEVARLSVSPPPPAPASAEDGVGEPSGIARVPPPPVRTNGNKPVGITEMLDENDLNLNENAETLIVLRQVASTLLEELDMGEVREAEKIEVVDISGYPGYENLNASKKILSRVMEQVAHMRNQGAELNVLYEATKKLIRKTGVDALPVPPAVEVKTALERNVGLEQTDVNAKMRDTLNGISREIEKQDHKTKMIYDALVKVQNTVNEGVE